MRHIDWLTDSFSIRTGDCIRWPFGYDGAGYPRVHLDDGAQERAHVVTCALARGPRPDGTEAAHACGMRWCVNPRHLRWLTPEANMLESVEHRTGYGLRTAAVPDNAAIDADRIAGLRQRYRAGGVTQQQLADELGVSQATISRYLHGYASRQ